MKIKYTILQHCSTATRVLLFVLLPMASSASWAVRDTIILDGETIYIEKKEVVTDLDSIQKQADLDFKKSNSDIDLPFFFAINAGANLTMAEHSGGLGQFQNLDLFMQRSSVSRFNATGGLELGYSFFKNKMGSLDVEGQLCTGLSFNKIKIGSYSFDESIMNKDSLIQVRKKVDVLELTYFQGLDTLNGVISGEVRIIDVPLKDNSIKLSTIDIPLKLRIKLGKSSGSNHFFVDAGIVYRKLSIKSFPHQYLINPNGHYLRFESSQFDNVSHLIYPQFAVGFMKSLNESFSGKGFLNKLCVGSYIQAWLPSYSVNRNVTFMPSAMGFQAIVFLGIDL